MKKWHHNIILGSLICSAPFIYAKDSKNISSNLRDYIKIQSPVNYVTKNFSSKQHKNANLDIVLTPKTTEAMLRKQLQPIGAELLAFNKKIKRATVKVDTPDQAEAIAKLTTVQYVYPDYGFEKSAGTVQSRAPQALKLSTLTNPPNSLTGAGQTVGILSDSFARTGSVRSLTTTPAPCVAGTLQGSILQNSNELPATIDIRADNLDPANCPNTGANTDEGAAMAELVHDIAPNAKIAFHAAGPGIAGFANGIEDLCKSIEDGGAGATVVVDDILYLTQLMYQEDAVAASTSECKSRGVAVFSAAGNNANLAFHDVYKDSNNALDNQSSNWNTSQAFDTSDLHEWSNGQNLLSIKLDAGEGFKAILQWNQPALSAPSNNSNAPQIDLDLYLFDSAGNRITENFAASSQDQAFNSSTTGADPTEIVVYTNNSSFTKTIKLGIDHWGGSQANIPQSSTTPLEFRLVFFTNGGQVLDTDFTPNADAPTIYGHPASDNFIAVAAVPWWEAPAFNPALEGTVGTDAESFTSKGGILEYHFNRYGSFSKTSSRQKPDFAAVDGNNTSFFGQQISLPGNYQGENDGHPNFFGTSAAAPNAAATAALMLEHKNLSPKTLRTQLIDNAVPAGDADIVGAGLIQKDQLSLAQIPSVNAGNAQSVIIGDSINLTAVVDNMNEVTNLPISYFWQIVDANIGTLSSNTSASTTFTANNFGTSIATVKAEDSNYDSTTDSVTIKVIEAIPIADAGDNRFMYTGEGIGILGKITNLTKIKTPNYKWEQVNGDFGILANQWGGTGSFRATKAGTATLKLTVKNSVGQSATDSITVTINDPAPIIENSDNKSVNIGQNIALTSTIQNLNYLSLPVSYEWKQTNGNNGTLTNVDQSTVVFTPTSTGEAIFEFKVTNAHGVSDTSTITVDIKPKPTTTSSSKKGGGGFWPLQYTLALVLMLLYRTRRKNS